MKRFILLGLLLAMASGPLASAAEGPDDQYVRLYNLLQQADEFSRLGNKREAFERYQAVQSGLRSMTSTFPEFNQRVLQFRLQYVAEKLAQFGPLPAPETAPTAAPAATAPTADQVEKPAAANVAPQEAQKIQALTGEVQRLGNEKALLEAKLREALSAQPATVEPRELAKTDEKIRALQKENDLLKLALDQQKNKPAPAGDKETLDTAKKSLAEAQRKLEEQTKTIAALREEKELLQSRLRSAETKAAPEVRPAAPTTAPEAKAETAALKRQIEDLQSQLKQARKAASKEAAAEAKAARAETKQIKSLQEERDELARKLAAAEQALKKGKDKTGAKTDSVPAAPTQALQSLQARLEALEARKVPYTPEELALFNVPTPVLAASSTTEPKAVTPGARSTSVKKPKASREAPVGAVPLLADAQKAFAAGQYAEAEQLYQRALLLDENNVPMLGDLAVTQMKQKRLEDAEKTLKKALELDPDDTFNLKVLGQLKLDTAKYDEAFDYLSRAARVDPKNPETQNYLGIALSHKGQREAAETALRRALQLAPDYAGAHHNLAIIYATQKPPYLELARFHYQKALTGGHPRNTDLDKILGMK